MSRPSTSSRLSGTQVGEQVELLPEPQQAGLGADLVGDLVPLRPADRAEDDGVGGLGLGEHLVGQRRAVLVDRATAAERLLGLELGLGFLGQERDQPVDLGHHLGADAVAGQEEQVVGRHGVPPLLFLMLKGSGGSARPKGGGMQGAAKGQ
jgi:hypothetical protein